MSVVKDFTSVFSTIKNHAVGTNLSSESGAFSGYNNRLWINTKYESTEPVWKENNIVFSNGWISPKTLIQENYLEVI